MTFIYLRFQFYFNLLLALEILAPHSNSTESLELSVRLEKIGVHEEWTLLSSLSHRRVGTHEAGWGFAWNFLDIVWFVGIRLVEVSDVQHLLFTHNFFLGIY